MPTRDRGARVLCPIHRPEQPSDAASVTNDESRPPMRGCQGNEFYDTEIEGNNMAYLDRGLFAGEVEGALLVTVMTADRLTDHGLLGKGTLHAVVTLGPSSFRTLGVVSKPEVTWNESSYLYLRKRTPQPPVVTIEVILLNEVKHRTSVGLVSFPLDATLRDGAAHERTFSLRVEVGPPRTTIRLQWSCAEDIAASAVLSANMASPEGVSPPLFGLMLPSSVTDGKLDWGALLAESGARVASQYEPVAYLDNTRTDTQAWVLREKEARNIVVAFRGADSKHAQGLITDVALAPVPAVFGSTVTAVGGFVRVVPPGDSSFSLVQSVFKDAKSGAVTAAQSLGRVGKQAASWAEGTFMGGNPDPAVMQPVLPPLPADQPWVHGGFYRSHNSVQLRLLEVLATLMADSGDEPWNVIVAGHSVGAALATLFACELATTSYQGLPAPRVSSYTFGSPRAGNAAFVAGYGLTVPDTWRITNSHDYVPTVPKLMGYCHVDHHVLLEGKAPFSIIATVGAAFEGTYAKQIFTQTIPSWTNRMLGRDRIATVEDPTDAEPTPAPVRYTSMSASEYDSGSHLKASAEASTGVSFAAEEDDDDIVAMERPEADDVDTDRFTGGHESSYLQNLTFLVTGAATRVSNETL